MCIFFRIYTILCHRYVLYVIDKYMNMAGDMSSDVHTDKNTNNEHNNNLEFK